MSRLFFDVAELGENRLQALPVEGPALIGSAPTAQVRLESAGVEPQHCRFDVDTLELEALAGGVEIDAKGLAAGSRMVLEGGSQVKVAGASLHLVVWQTELARQLPTHQYFEQRGAEECIRCRRKKTTFSVLNVVSPLRERSAEFESALASTVRLTDALSWYAPGAYEIMLFETSPQGAELVASRIRRIVDQLSLGCVVGLAHFPVDGQTIDALIATAHAKTLGLTSLDADSGAMPVVEHDSLVDRVARSELPVLILGETGSGKEVMASRLHALSRRAHKPYVKFNCAAFTESLFESELFGHERGSFTGAHATKPGLLETADGGTVFLDEVGEMPLSMQVKLLRVIEERQVLRVGAVRPTAIDVRFIAATNRDLQAEIAKGTFRSDLYFRLDGTTLIVPPLRERLGELPQLVDRLLGDIAARSKLPQLPRISPGSVELLKQYRWPGNIRELRNVLERAVLMADGAEIHRRHLPTEKLVSRFAEYDPGRFGARRGIGTTQLEPHSSPGRPPAHGQSPVEAGEGLSMPLPSPPVPSHLERPPTGVDSAVRRGLGLLLPTADRKQLADQERATIERTLQQCAGNQSEAARRLGISRQTLIKRIERYGLARPRAGLAAGVAAPRKRGA
jgi:DNA-binding NtrC family response regulator